MKFTLWTNGRFALPIIKEFSSEIDFIVTGSDKPTGRGQRIIESPAKVLAKELNIEYLQTDTVKSDELTDRLKARNPDMYIVCDFGMILPEEIISIPEKSTYNIHPSYLPYYKGPDPIQWVILRGEKETGTTIHRISTDIDSGRIVLQYKCNIDDDDNYIDLYNKLSMLSVNLLKDFLEHYKNGSIEEKEQGKNEDKLFYARKLKKEERFINWNKSSIEIRNQVRALYKRPTAGFFYKNKLFKVYKVDIFDYIGNEKSGTVLSFNKNDLFTVKTADSAVKIYSIQPENKRLMDVKDFINGYRIEEGELL